MIDIENYLNNFFKGTKNPSLKAMHYFMNKFDNFEKNMKFIHIAGTNGKGSCTEMISNILKEQGYKVGKFLSPHLIRYNERISINGKEISDKEMSDIIEELAPLIKEYNQKEINNITLFELETTMALLYFYRNNVDFVVLETGLGGLFDCTNVITKPLVSIITSIGYDHMNILGNTLPEIAFQKAGIIKENSSTVIFKQSAEVDKVFKEQCKLKNNSLHIIKDTDISNYRYDSTYQYFNFKNIKNIALNLKGKVQIKNASICIEAINIIKDYGYKIETKSVLNGLKTVVHKARLETLNECPKIIYDGAHNEPAIKNLLEMVNMYYPNTQRRYIISILNRKDYKEMLKLLSKDDKASFIMTSGNDIERYTTSEELYDYMKKYVNTSKISKSTLNNTVKYIFSSKENNTINFFIGSFYAYKTVLNEIKKYI